MEELFYSDSRGDVFHRYVLMFSEDPTVFQEYCFQTVNNSKKITIYTTTFETWTQRIKKNEKLTLGEIKIIHQLFFKHPYSN